LNRLEMEKKRSVLRKAAHTYLLIAFPITRILLPPVNWVNNKR